MDTIPLHLGGTPGARPDQFELRRVYRWNYFDPVMGPILESKLMQAEEALTLDADARIVAGSEVVIEERRSAGAPPKWL